MIKVPKITLKAARVNAGLTQKEAAKKIGISYQTLSDYEKDGSKIKVSILNKCVLYMDCQQNIFF